MWFLFEVEGKVEKLKLSLFLLIIMVMIMAIVVIVVCHFNEEAKENIYMFTFTYPFHESFTICESLASTEAQLSPKRIPGSFMGHSLPSASAVLITRE